jgi:hypothetical protein
MIHKTQKEKPLTDQYFNLETNQQDNKSEI